MNIDTLIKNLIDDTDEILFEEITKNCVQFTLEMDGTQINPTIPIMMPNSKLYVKYYYSIHDLEEERHHSHTTYYFNRLYQLEDFLKMIINQSDKSWITVLQYVKNLHTSIETLKQQVLRKNDELNILDDDDDEKAITVYKTLRQLRRKLKGCLEELQLFNSSSDEQSTDIKTSPDELTHI